MRFRWYLLVLLSPLTGCGDSNPTSPQSARWFWLGSFTGDADHGVMAIDAVQTGTAISGTVLFGPTTSSMYPQFVLGTLRNGTLHLEHDPSLGQYTYTFTLDGHVGAGSALTGSLSFSPTSLTAAIDCRSLQRQQVTSVQDIDLPAMVTAVAFDGQYVWLSTPSHDYIRLRTDGTIEDTVVVFYDTDLHWTSSALAFDGAHLWGFLPRTEGTPSGDRNVSVLVEFDANGVIDNSHVLPHRTSGLTYDGVHYWSLANRHLYQFEPTGAVVDSIALDVPDPYQLVFARGHFWTTSWYTKKVYEIDASGTTVALYDLPDTGHVFFQGGIAFEGTRLWCVEGDPFDGLARIHVVSFDGTP